jgi:hypothetical protein
VSTSLHNLKIIQFFRYKLRLNKKHQPTLKLFLEPGSLCRSSEHEPGSLCRSSEHEPGALCHSSEHEPGSLCRSSEHEPGSLCRSSEHEPGSLCRSSELEPRPLIFYKLLYECSNTISTANNTVQRV